MTDSPQLSRPRTLAPSPLSATSQLTTQLEQTKPGNEGTFPEYGPQLPTEEYAGMKAPTNVETPEAPTQRSRTPLPPESTGGTATVPAVAPATPHRTASSSHGLSLQVPPRLFGNQPNSIGRGPISPKLDSSQIYASPSSVLPRRSRGLDFSRASTNLHHSTLAEASPDSSPVVAGRGVSIPQRRSAGNGILASPNNGHHGFWSSSAHPDKNTISGSVSSINMLDSDTSSSSDEDEDDSPPMDRLESVFNTPHANRIGNGFSNPFSPSVMQSPGGDWMNSLSTAKASLMNFQRARLRTRTRHSSASTSTRSSKPSPGPRSPPIMKSVEGSSSYFPKEAIMADVMSRRGSVNLGTSDLHISDMSDDGDNRQGGVSTPSSGSLASSNPESGRRGVIRRPVTRRGNLLPKSKNFARIRAALVEEGAPIESEAKREAEVIRQVRENDEPIPPLSPTLIPSTKREATGDEDAETGADNPPVTNFSQQVSEKSGGIHFWNSFDGRYRTPPPTSQREPVLGDPMLETPPGSLATGTHLGNPQAPVSQSGFTPTPSEIAQRISKRRRVDDLDLTSFKRRAVSPGTSVQSSPSQSQTFSFPDQAPKAKVCSSSTQSTSGHSGPVKRVGLQGMNETNEGLMNMSID